jgi:hypothetical protein
MSKHKAAAPQQAVTAKANATTTAQPGIIASIITQLTEAKAKKKPVTVAGILDTLQKQFPDRKREGMQITVRAQLSRLPDERDFAISKKREGRHVTYMAK